MRCGICHAPLRASGISRKSGRMSPTYHPCPRLTDPVAHPARARAIADAEAKSAMYLGNANEHTEAGRPEAAQRDLDRSQRWLDKANELRGWGEGRR
jgi:hypothetical protein